MREDGYETTQIMSKVLACCTLRSLVFEPLTAQSALVEVLEAMWECGCMQEGGFGYAGPLRHLILCLTPCSPLGDLHLRLCLRLAHLLPGGRIAAGLASTLVPQPVATGVPQGSSQPPSL